MSELGHDLNSTLDYIEGIYKLLASIDAKLSSQAGGVSSVEVKTSTRGVDIAVKAYSGSPIEPAGNAAADEFIRVGKEVERRLTGQA